MKKKFGFGTKNLKRIWWKKIYYTIFGIMYNDYLRFKHINKYLIIPYIQNKKENIKIFDAGSGEGNYSFFFAQNYKNILIDAYEIDKNLFLKTEKLKEKEKLNNLNIYNKKIEDNPKKNYYDFILLFGILDFNKNIEKILDKLYYNLRKGGKLIIFSMSKEEELYFKINLDKTHKTKDGLRKNKGFDWLKLKKYLKKYEICEYNYLTSNKILKNYLLFNKFHFIFKLLFNPLLKLNTILLLKNKYNPPNKGIHLMVIARRKR